MKKVWKCDYCNTTRISFAEMLSHENNCAFNPDNKYCYTCLHAFEDGAPISGSHTSCKIGKDTFDGQEEGHCDGWEHNLI